MPWRRVPQNRGAAARCGKRDSISQRSAVVRPAVDHCSAADKEKARSCSDLPAKGRWLKEPLASREEATNEAKDCGVTPKLKLWLMSRQDVRFFISTWSEG